MKIKPFLITQWTKQLAILLAAHLPLMQALDLLAQAQTHKPLQRLTQIIVQEIMNGNPLSMILRRYPKWFDQTYCQLIYTAEQSGSLAPILQKIAEGQRLRQQIQQQLVKALIYPGLVLCVGVGVFILLLAWVVPQLAQVFKQFKQALPWFTQLILDVAGWIQNNGLYGLGLLLFFLFLGYGLQKYSIRAALWWARCQWRCPFIGVLFQQAACVLFSRTLSLLLTTGIPIATGLPMTQQVIRNPYAQQRLQIAVLLINQGHSFSYAMQQTQLFPHLAVQMWKIGEHTGKLHLLLDDAASYYQQQLDTLIQHFTQLIEPVLLIILGLLIGSVVIAMYLPLFQVGLIMGG